jgi:DNA repair ATPase RecN
MSATYKEEKHALATFIARFSYLYFHFELDAATVNDIIDSYIEENRSYRRWYNDLLTLATTRYALSEVDGHLKELETRLTDVENNSFSFQNAVADRVTTCEGKIDSINELQASSAEANRKYNELLHQLKEVQYESVKGLGVLADAVTEIFAAQYLTLPKELGHKLKALKAARDALPESP